MNLQPDTKQARQPGGRFGAKLPPPAPLTVAQELARLDALRNANGGWLVPPPPGIDNARMAPLEGAQTVAKPNAEWLALMGWLESIVAVGGEPGDLARAWAHWSPPVWSGGAHPRALARDAFDTLTARAREQTAALRRRAEIEARPQTAVRSARFELKRAEQALAGVEARYRLLREARDLAKAKLDEAASAAGEAA